MAYADNFAMADDFIVHLDGVMDGIADPYIQNRYLGFVALTAVTVFELSIKEVLCTFADKKHSVLGNMTRSKMEQINGRIKLENLQKEFIRPFGEKYLERFKKKVERSELESLKLRQGSIKASYGNMIQWRHDFVHKGKSPETSNYAEVKAAYQRGKEIIHCLNATMIR